MILLIYDLKKRKKLSFLSWLLSFVFDSFNVEMDKIHVKYKNMKINVHKIQLKTC